MVAQKHMGVWKNNRSAFILCFLVLYMHILFFIAISFSSEIQQWIPSRSIKKQSNTEISRQTISLQDENSQIQLNNCPNRKGRNLLIDLGANCGNSFRILARRYGNFDGYYLWEMNPFLQSQLQKIAREVENVTIVPYGAWHEHTTMEMDIIGENQDACNSEKSFWDGTTIVETGWIEDDNSRYNSTVQVETMDFSAWYKDTICLQDKVSLKMDIEKSEYPVLANMFINGLICHPRHLLVEFHPTGKPLQANQHLTQWSVKDDMKKQCFTAGFISTLEYMIQFCQHEPKLLRWN